MCNQATPERPPQDATGPDAAPPPPRRHRHKLWELPRRLHCPVIGTCLPAAELRRLARKVRLESDGPLNDYQLHVAFAGSAGSRGPISTAAHKALERRYAADVRRLARARTPAELAARWQEAVEAGDVAGALWATVTHPACSEALQDRVFEEVHMLSHQMGAGQMADLRRVQRLQGELRQLEGDFEALQARTRSQLEDREQRILDLEARLARAEAERARLAGRERALEQQVEGLEARAAAAGPAPRQEPAPGARAEWQAALEAARARIGALEAEARERDAELAALERLIAERAPGCEGCATGGCPGGPPDLAGRRVLCVGGRTALVDRYRDLVARCNGHFEHHDGGLEDRRRRLESLLSTADAVVCATDCVSHDASLRLKRFCRQHDKPHVFLRSSGVSSFARALELVAIPDAVTHVEAGAGAS
jgi:hypothetical protein